MQTNIYFIRLSNLPYQKRNFIDVLYTICISIKSSGEKLDVKQLHKFGYMIFVGKLFLFLFIYYSNSHKYRFALQK